VLLNGAKKVVRKGVWAHEPNNSTGNPSVSHSRRKKEEKKKYQCDPVAGAHN